MPRVELRILVMAWAVAWWSASAALAAGGALEINHTCATTTGCFAGDGPGYPVTIVRSGSYRLTGSLVVPDADTSAILIGASDTTLDLGGFEIARAGCEGGGGCLAVAGSGSGVASGGPVSPKGVTVRGGSIVGMGGDSVSLLGRATRVRDLRVRVGSGTGIHVGDDAIVEGCAVVGGGGTGILTGAHAVVSHNTSRGNATGIEVGAGSTVSENTAAGNSLDGIVTGVGASVYRNAAFENQRHGIRAGTGATVSGNAAHGNGDFGIEGASGSVISNNAVYQNGGFGIDAGTSAVVSGNAVYQNGSVGIVTGFRGVVRDNTVGDNAGGTFFGTGTSFRGNTISNNNGSTVVGGIDVGANVCDGTPGCP